MAGDYIPHSESELATWADAFVEFAHDHAAELGLSADELAELTADHESFNATYAAYADARTAASVACHAKDDARRRMVPRLRSIAMRMQMNPNISDGQRRGLGLSIGTPVYHTPLSRSEERPIAAIDVGIPLRHAIRIMNMTSTGIHRARPANATGCELWRTVVTSDGEGKMEYIGMVTHNPYIVRYSMTDGGATVRYKMRWIGRRGEKSAWSDPHTATVAA